MCKYVDEFFICTFYGVHMLVGNHFVIQLCLIGYKSRYQFVKPKLQKKKQTNNKR